MKKHKILILFIIISISTLLALFIVKNLSPSQESIASHDMSISDEYSPAIYEGSFVSAVLHGKIEEIYDLDHNSALYFLEDNTIYFFYHYTNENNETIFYESEGKWRESKIGWAITFDNEEFAKKKVTAKIIGKDEDGFPLLSLEWPISDTEGYLTYYFD